MALDQNLMGLGLPAPLAIRVANGGTGPVTIAAAGTSTATGTQIRGKQFVTYVGSGSGWAALPTVGGSDNAAEIADDFVIHNGLSSNLTVGIPTGVTVNIGGSNITSQFTITTAKTFTGWVVSTTQWFGIVA